MGVALERRKKEKKEKRERKEEKKERKKERKKREKENGHPNSKVQIGTAECLCMFTSGIQNFQIILTKILTQFTNFKF